MTTITCDVCGGKVGAAGFKVVSVGDAPQECNDVRGEYCSAACITRALAKAGVRRPAFAETRAVLEQGASLRDLDERFMRGEYGTLEPTLVPVLKAAS